jgi:hypothetical protein
MGTESCMEPDVYTKKIRVLLDLKTGKVLREELIDCEPYPNTMRLFAECLIRHGFLEKLKEEYSV